MTKDTWSDATWGEKRPKFNLKETPKTRRERNHNAPLHKLCIKIWLWFHIKHVGLIVSQKKKKNRKNCKIKNIFIFIFLLSRYPSLIQQQSSHLRRCCRPLSMNSQLVDPTQCNSETQACTTIPITTMVNDKLIHHTTSTTPNRSS